MAEGIRNGVYLTKSRYVNGLKCPKWVWLAFNDKGALPPTDASTQQRFDEGRAVGELAKTLFPNGVDIKEIDISKNAEATKKKLNEGRPLFEAGFIDSSGRLYARADVLIPVELSGKVFDLVEVKSSTKVKEEHIWDMAFQKYCFETNGLNIRKCTLAHVNNQYVREGELDLDKYFVFSDITKEVELEIKKVPEKIEGLIRIIQRENCPQIKYGEEYCKDELNVHSNDRFFKENPDCDIFDLYGKGEKVLELFVRGVYRIKDLGPMELDNPRHKIQHRCAVSNEPYFDSAALTQFLNKLKYPLHFMDFETFGLAIPLYDGTRPYQQIPFQYSLHVVDEEGGTPKHFSFIASGEKDPRKEFIDSLKEKMGEKGSVVIYKQSVEGGILKKLSEQFFAYRAWVDGVNARMVDLLVPFKEFAYYNPLQHGSASIKHVLPAMTGKSYSGFEIANGQEASVSYAYISQGKGGKKASAVEIAKIRSDLERYCEQDTLAMIWITERLKEIVKVPELKA